MSMIFFLRSFVTGFVHSYLLEDGQTQIIILIIIKIAIMYFLFLLRKDANSLVNFIFDFIFYTTGLLLDCLIFICNVRDQSIDFTYLKGFFSNMELKLIFAMFAATILPIFYHAIYIIIKSKRKSNKIAKVNEKKPAMN